MATLNSLKNKFLYQTQHCAEAMAVDKALFEFMSADARRGTMDREGSLCFSIDLSIYQHHVMLAYDDS